MLKELLSQDQITAHLEETHSVKVNKVTKLDWNVHRIDLEDGRSWVMRVFTARNKRVIESLAVLLKYLHEKNYPAEAPVSLPVTTTEDGNSCFLLTKFVRGQHPERNRATFFRLGKLLGQLHTLPVTDDLPVGGAWHHLSIAGSIADESEAAVRMLRNLQGRTDSLGTDMASNNDIDTLVTRLERLRSLFEDNPLPKCIAHPDLVPVNVIEEPGSSEETASASAARWTIVDWTGSGVGCRVLSLGVLLSVAAAKGKLILVDYVMKGYSEFITLEDSELEVLPQAVYSRFLNLHAWEVAMERKSVKTLAEALQKFMELGENVAQRVREIVKGNESNATE